MKSRKGEMTVGVSMELQGEKLGYQSLLNKINQDCLIEITPFELPQAIPLCCTILKDRRSLPRLAEFDPEALLRRLKTGEERWIEK